MALLTFSYQICEIVQGPMGEDVAHLSESHTMGTHDELEYGKEDTAHIFIYRASMGDQKYAPKLGIWVWRPKSMFIQRW